MSTDAQISLIENGNASSGWVSWPGGVGTFSVAGNLNGATISLQMLLPDMNTAHDLGDPTSFTAPGAGNFELGQCMIRANVTGGTPSGLYATVSGVAY